MAYRVVVVVVVKEGCWKDRVIGASIRQMLGALLLLADKLSYDFELFQRNGC